MNVYEECPAVKTKSFTVRLIRQSDSDGLYECYHDEEAVRFMNDDNCDFGFYAESPERMAETVGYWIDFYEKQYFVRFAVVDNASGKAVGTIEGFNGETGVLRVDIASVYERTEYLSELFQLATDHFYEWFGNEVLVTKAVEDAGERRDALAGCGWEYIDVFRDYRSYYRIRTQRGKGI